MKLIIIIIGMLFTQCSFTQDYLYTMLYLQNITQTMQNNFNFKMWTLTRVFREIYLHLIVQEIVSKWWYRSLWGTPGGSNLHKLAYSIWVFENRCHREPHCQCKKCRQYFQPIGELTTKVRKRNPLLICTLILKNHVGKLKFDELDF